MTGLSIEDAESLRMGFDKAKANLNLEYEEEDIRESKKRLDSYLDLIISGKATFEQIEQKLLDELKASKASQSAKAKLEAIA